MFEPQVPEIDSFMVSDSRVRTQHRCQLTAADIDGNHLLAAARQQHLGETSCRSARVEGSSSHAELEVIQAPMSL